MSEDDHRPNPSVILAGKSNGFIRHAKKILEKEGFRVTAVFSVKKLHQELLKNNAHLVIPDSFELSKEIQSLTKKIISERENKKADYPKILLLIDIEDRALYTRAIDWGVDGFFNKNQDIRLLTLQIRNLTGGISYPKKGHRDTDDDFLRPEKILDSIKEAFQSIGWTSEREKQKSIMQIKKVFSQQRFLLDQMELGPDIKEQARNLLRAFKYSQSETEKLILKLIETSSETVFKNPENFPANLPLTEKTQ